MNPQVVECIPNVSEGRDRELVEALAREAGSVAGAAVLDVHMDADHHRAVLTIAGTGPAVSEAAFRLARLAVARIDIRAHRGVHPRAGAIDVVPFVPLHETTLDECISLARAFARKVERDLTVPSVLYGAASEQPGVRLADIRRGHHSRAHPTAGAVCVGARPALVAFNVLLETRTRAIASDIARAVRASSGGLPGLQALGFLVAAGAQVSMNITDVDRTSVQEAFDAVSREAERRGVRIVSSEIVGLAPAAALRHARAGELALVAPIETKVLERRLADQGMGPREERPGS